MAFADAFCSVDLSDTKVKTKKQRRCAVCSTATLMLSGCREEKAAAREAAGDNYWAEREAKKAREEEAKEVAAQIASKGSAKADKALGQVTQQTLIGVQGSQQTQVANTLSFIAEPTGKGEESLPLHRP